MSPTAGLVLLILLVQLGVCWILLAYAAPQISIRFRRLGLGRIYIGRTADPYDHADFGVDVQKLTYMRGNGDERTLQLTVHAEGVHLEVNLGDGSDLLRQIYEGRMWLFESEAQEKSA